MDLPVEKRKGESKMKRDYFNTIIHDYDYHYSNRYIGHYYYPEHTRFINRNYFLRRRRLLKLGLIVTALKEDLVKRDYLLTLYNNLKTFLIINTTLQKHYDNKRRCGHLTSRTIARLKHDDLFITRPNLLYHSISRIAHRNISLSINRYKKRYKVRSFIKYVRPLNKLLFFSLFRQLINISFKTPMYINYDRRRNYKFIRILLGYKIRVVTFYLSVKTLFKKSLRIFKPRIKRNLRRIFRSRYHYKRLISSDRRLSRKEAKKLKRFKYYVRKQYLIHYKKHRQNALYNFYLFNLLNLKSISRRKKKRLIREKFRIRSYSKTLGYGKTHYSLYTKKAIKYRKKKYFTSITYVKVFNKSLPAIKAKFRSGFIYLRKPMRLRRTQYRFKLRMKRMKRRIKKIRKKIKIKGKLIFKKTYLRIRRSKKTVRSISKRWKISVRNKINELKVKVRERYFKGTAELFYAYRRRLYYIDKEKDRKHLQRYYDRKYILYRYKKRFTNGLQKPYIHKAFLRRYTLNKLEYKRKAYRRPRRRLSRLNQFIALRSHIKNTRKFNHSSRILLRTRL